MQKLKFSNNGIELEFGVTAQNKLLLFHCGLSDLRPDDDRYLEFQTDEFRAFEVQISGGHINYGHGTKNLGLSESAESKYISHKYYKNEFGDKLEMLVRSDNLEIVLNYQFFDDLPVIKSWTGLKNITKDPINIEYVSSFLLYGIGKNNEQDDPYKDISLLTSYNTSYRECQWRDHALQDLGFVASSKYSSTCHKVNFFNTGSWSTKQHLPKGIIQNKRSSENIYWQIESNGSWCFELGDYQSCLYFSLSGPNQTENQWIRELKSSEEFVSVAAMLSFSKGDPTAAFENTVKYTRRLRRKHFDNVELPIIFNPYMHNAGENPTQSQTLRDLEGIKDLDIDYFCIDAGWHDEENYWKAIGDWNESKLRFADGLNFTFDKVRQKGIKPGLWLEIEMMGFFNPKKNELDVDCYFIRGGGIVSNLGRMQLDFSNSKNIKRISAIMDRIVRDYKVEYIKIDYNADCGAGTELNSKSLGDGLLRHNRAYIEWLRAFMDKYPKIIVEGCASGGLRTDPLMMSIHSIFSTSDQTNYKLYPYIASNMLTNGTPEQMAVWCYPLASQDNEAVIMNVVNTLLGRMHLSGESYKISGIQRELLKEGLKYHRTITQDKIKALPFFPLGINNFGSDFCAAGIKTDKKAYLALWNLGETKTVEIPLAFSNIKSVKNGYPQNFGDVSYKYSKNVLKISFSGEQARMLEIIFE